MNHALTQAIRETITFFDVLDHPLTTLELKEYLRFPQAVSLREVSAVAHEVPGVTMTSGLWHLQGREDLVARRQQAYTLVHDKLTRARTALWWITKLPTVEAAYICNNLGFCTAHQASDIDLFIITRPRTLWVTRLFALGIAELTGLRIHGNNAADKLCLSFFLSGDALDIGWLQKQDDVYLQFWMHGLVPLTPASRVHPFFAANAWMQPYSAGVRSKEVSTRRLYTNAISYGAPFMRLFESCARRLQLRFMSQATRAAAADDTTDVVMSEQMLKFHDHDRRAEYARAFHQRLLSQ